MAPLLLRRDSMKTKATSSLRHSNFNRMKLAAFAAVGSLTLPLAAQSVVIEGGPGAVQISDQDGKPEPVVAGNTPITAPVITPEVPVPTAVTPVTPTTPAASPVIPGQPVTPEVTTDGIIAPAPRMVGPANDPVAQTNTADSVDTVERINVDVAKRLTEIERDLNIASASTGAKIKIETNDLFVDQTTAVEATAEPTLSTIAEYIKLSENEVVDVTYHYTPVTESEKQAWDRSVALIEWMSNKGQTNADQYEIGNPEVVEADDTAITTEGGESAEFTGIIELVIR